MNESDIVQFLLANPQFFNEHADLLNRITLVSPHGNRAISLAERQLQILRDKNTIIDRRLNDFLRHGHENDRLAKKLTQWVQYLLAERDLQALPTTISKNLTTIFNVPYVMIRLWQVADEFRNADFASQVAEDLRLFVNGLNGPYCTIKQQFSAVNFLAGDTDSLASLAILPLAFSPPTFADPINLNRDNNDSMAASTVIPLAMPESKAATPFGVMILGDITPERFYHDSSTDFLCQLMTLTSAALSRLNNDPT